MAVVIVIFFIVLIIGGVIALVIYASKKAAERTRQMQLVAAQMGWGFYPKADLSAIPYAQRFHLLSQGHSKSVINMLYGQVNNTKAAAFDYTYVTGYGRSRQSHTQTVVYLESQRLNLPDFSLRPENVFSKAFSALGYQDIDFAHKPLFSGKYLLRGADEQAIRRTFNDRILSFYEANLKMCTDGGGNQLLIYRERTQLQPQEVRLFMDWSFGALNLFQQPW